MKTKKIPMRMCVGCGNLKMKKELLRIVALPTGFRKYMRNLRNK